MVPTSLEMLTSLRIRIRFFPLDSDPKQGIQYGVGSVLVPTQVIQYYRILSYSGYRTVTGE